MDKKRVCVFCEKWGSGGIESFLLNVFEHMERSELEIEVVAVQKDSDFYLPRLDALHIPFTELTGTIHTLSKNHAAFSALLARRHFDAVHFNIYHALSLQYARDAEKAGIPVRIAHSHNAALRKSPLRPLKLAIHNWCKRVYADTPTKLLACSRVAAEFLFPAGKNVQLLQNGIDLDRFTFDPAERDRVRRNLGVQNRFVIGTVGRLCQQKNQQFLLKVLAALHPRHPEMLLLLVGEGELREKLQTLAAELGIEDSVIFYGTSRDVPSLLCAMDVFALPSLFEGLSLVAVEAQAAGLPTLCSTGLTPEAVLTDLAQRIPLDVPQWTDAIANVPVRPRPVTAEQLRRQGYDIRDTAARLQKLYLEAEAGGITGTV